MSALQKIAYFKNRRDEAPNQDLARALARARDAAGIREIVEGLRSEDKAIQADCLKVLYEIGAIDPVLIAGYADDLLKLLGSRDNRLVWGAMTALAAIAPVQAERLYAHRAEVQRAVEQGSVITKDNGLKALALIAAHKAAYARQIVPFLLSQLGTCRPKDVAQYAEKTLVAISAAHRGEFVRVLERRLVGLKPSQAARVKKVLRAARPPSIG